MNNFIGKLRLIFVPFLVLAVCIIGGYTFLNWLLFIKWQAFSMREEVVNIYIPFALSWILVIIWLRPRIKLLNLKRKKSDLPGLYIFLAGLIIAIPAVIAQSYLETASGKLTQLENINQIKEKGATKYYTLKNFYIDKTHFGVKSTFDISGKRNQHLNMHLYLALPILASVADTSNENCLAWYGIKYYKQISNQLSDQEKEDQFDEFANESQRDLEEKDVRRFIYFYRIGNTDDHPHYIAAIKKNERYSKNSTTVLMPVNEPYGSRNGNKLAWVFGALGIGTLVWLLMISIPVFDDTALEKFRAGTVEKSTDGNDVLGLLLPRKEYFITPVIVDINILVFILMVISGLGFISFNAVDLIPWGANYKPVTSNGEWWRLLTSVFLHGGLMHLGTNMFTLIFAGVILEPKLGKAKFAIIYLLTGMLASITSLWWPWHKAMVSVGASGAIFGLYGLLLALILTKAFPKELGKAFVASTVIFIVFNLVMGFAGGIDNAAHVGGLVSGFILGIVLSPQLKRDGEYEQPEKVINE